MTTLQASAQQQLRQMIESIERLEEEKKSLAGDIRDKYLEAKGLGFDVKILREVIRLRKKSQTEREEHQSLLDVYLHALNMLHEEAQARAAMEKAVASEE
jgi:uncharacterized protein (UPF0335 family)